MGKVRVDRAISYIFIILDFDHTSGIPLVKNAKAYKSCMLGVGLSLYYFLINL